MNSPSPFFKMSPPITPPSSSGLSRKMSAKNKNWLSISANERANLAAKIPIGLQLHPSVVQSLLESTGSILDFPRQCGLLNNAEIDITENYDAVSLLEAMASGVLTSFAVTTAFCKRAAIAHQLANCLTEIMFDEALARAAYCDEYLARENKLLGPLHGLPISLSDSFNIKGFRSTLGYLEFLKREPEDKNCALVDVLSAQGAVLYVKTNVSQTLMASDTHNNLFGRTANPCRLGLTAGGASGGEAALIALRGSVLGVGTDSAGNIRIPAMCCGLTGFKPSCRRIPFGGQSFPGRRGAFGILPAAGPICHTVRDAEYFMKSVLQYDCWTLDEELLSVPWLQPSQLSQKRFGIIFEDPKYPLHPAALRTFQEILQRLSTAGHQLVSLGNLLPADIIYTTALTSMTILNMDPEKTPYGFVARGGEPLVPSIAAAIMPELSNMKPNINGVFNLNKDISRIRSMFREVIVQNSLDGILMPVYQATAVAHDEIREPAYAVLANILDYPACVLPYGKAEKMRDAAFVRDVLYTPELNPDAVEGASCSIQVIGRNMRDEDLLANAQLIESILRA